MKTEPDRLLRLRQVLQRVPVSRSAWYLGIRSGRYPAPVRLGPRTSAWRESEVQKVVNGTFQGGQS
ncbi:MAG: AlpA family phage regulatory protein [Desulfohalobiaceae bacterium]|nr:AlpA family phage regulatory protein [Desulfohalobiaceae bacterium]MCF8105409.1 AlpA family phage regulatory protein [Desulfohalobiaceae bacterium]